MNQTQYDYSGKEFWERPLGTIMQDLEQQGIPHDQAAVMVVAVHNMLGYLPDGTVVKFPDLNEIKTPSAGSGWKRYAPGELPPNWNQTTTTSAPQNPSESAQVAQSPQAAPTVPQGVRVEDLMNPDGSYKSQEEVNAMLSNVSQAPSPNTPQSASQGQERPQAPQGYRWEGDQLVLDENSNQNAVNRPSPVAPPQ